MGLLKAGVGALSGVLADQWREYFYSEALEQDVITVKGVKRTSKRSSNTKAEENIISNGSIVAVNDGQCMIIFEQGKVVDLCAVPGEYVYDSSTEPSVFVGSLGHSASESFKTLGKRFTFGGDTAKDQRVYYFNTKELIGNKYGTANPVPFRIVDKNVGLDVDIAIRCYGEYSYRVVDPILFYVNVCGNVERAYRRAEIDSQLKSELLTALQPAFAKISEMGIRYSALPGHTPELAEALNEVLSQKWRELRGIAIISLGVSSVTASDEDEEMIKTLQRSAAFRDPSMAAAQLVGAQAEAMRNAAKNEGGAFVGFAGLNMAQTAGGANPSDLYAMGARAGQRAGSESWVCGCGTSNTGKFCANCGKIKSEAGWVCGCDSVNKGKFCSECGKPRPAGALLYKCDKCDWEPADPAKPPKFCPECGDPFDEGDVK
ncbi:MAG: SPFH domain-containing protein [Oscillospiraceae bacterium]|jgi:membrane protease subunit (stomatin/prohibitin family)|nr:SPFH domain-containing protein [Oscillospiraceae bacterium]